MEGFIYNINVNYDTKEAFLLIFPDDNLHLWLKRRLHQKSAPSLIIKTRDNYIYDAARKLQNLKKKKLTLRKKEKV